MRVVVTLLIAAGVVALHALDNPEGFARVWGRFTSSTEAVLQDKEIRIDGLNRLPRTEVERLLPLDRTVAWWHANSTEVQAAVRRNPWVAEANVSACPDTIKSRWGCFVVSIKERVPTFLASIDNMRWIIDREGSFIVPQSDATCVGDGAGLIGVSGLASRAHSPDLVKAQLSAASRLVQVLEKRVGRAITTLEFHGQGDFAVQFKGLEFPIVFAAGRDSKIPLAEQGERCAELLKHLAGRLAEIQKIDLAFTQVGVVTFLPTPAAERTAG